MNSKIVCVLSLIGFTGLAVPVFAGPAGIPRPQTNQQAAAIVNNLEARKDQLSQEAALLIARGPLRIAYMDKQSQLDDAIVRLQSGQPVAISEINNALGPVTD
jgi:hypothetical protein